MNVIPIKGAREAPAASRSTMETEIVTSEIMASWKLPRFQRPLKVNAKVLAVAAELENDPIIKGVITLGQLPEDPHLYLVDGQHRRESAKIATMRKKVANYEFIADIRIMQFKSMAAMAEEASKLQGQLVKTQPDDILKAMEESVKVLQLIRRRCGFIGYSHIRTTSVTAPILGMSSTLRCWYGSSFDVPNVCGVASAIAEELTTSEAEQMIEFLEMAYTAWGRDIPYWKLWSGVNLSICMWLWRNLVLDQDRRGKRYAALTREQFQNCLNQLSTNKDYLSFLSGRSMRDRGPAYGRIKKLFAARLAEEGARITRMPQPIWANS